MPSIVAGVSKVVTKDGVDGVDDGVLAIVIDATVLERDPRYTEERDGT